MNGRKQNMAAGKTAKALMMLPLLVLLLFSCPVKRALNPFLNPATSSGNIELINMTQLKEAKSVISLNHSSCSPLDKEIKAQSPVSLQNIPPTFLSNIFHNFQLCPATGRTNPIDYSKASYISSTSPVPVFLRNNAILI